jgi:hypothetical protein
LPLGGFFETSWGPKRLPLQVVTFFGPLGASWLPLGGFFESILGDQEGYHFKW